MTGVVLSILLAIMMALSWGGVCLAQDNSDDQASAAPDPSYASPATTSNWWDWRSPPDTPEGEDSPDLVYLQFWQRRVAAAANPVGDTQIELRIFEDGPALQRELADLNKLRAAGHAEIIRVQHNPRVVYWDGQQFVVFDDWLNASYLVDARTKAPIGDGPNVDPAEGHQAYLLKKVPDEMSGVGYFIKVVDAVDVTYQ